MRGVIKWTLEDVVPYPYGFPMTIEFDLNYTYHPGERMVMYYPDGSGYPGSPAEVEWEATVTKVESFDGEDLTIIDWKKLAEWFHKHYSSDEAIYMDIVSDACAEDDSDYAYDSYKDEE